MSRALDAAIRQLWLARALSAVLVGGSGLLVIVVAPSAWP
jgi:hypothetical protein